MKRLRLMLITTVLLALIATPALATPTINIGDQSMGWWKQGDPGTTYQVWDFTLGHVGTQAGITATPEQVFNPRPNQVVATIIGGTWDGVTNINGTSIYVDLEIPNYENLNTAKYIWVDVGGQLIDGISVSATDGGSMSFTYAILPGQGNADFGIKIMPNPYTEKIDFLVSGPMDYIHVDTICIPAPGAILLGGIGVSLVGWLRRRRTL